MGLFDVESTVEVQDWGIYIASTHEANQERGGLP
jgi:hypothetical protein